MATTPAHEAPLLPSPDAPARNDVQLALWRGERPSTPSPTVQVSAKATRASRRDRVTIELRGLGPRLHAQAKQRQTTVAVLVRHAVLLTLADGTPEQMLPSGVRKRGTQVVKVTLRLSDVHASALAHRARMADMAQGDFVGALLDGTPPAALPADHATAVAALMQSTDRLSAMSGDLNAFMRLLGRVPASQLEPYRAGVLALTKDVRAHLASAARLVAELKASGRGRR